MGSDFAERLLVLIAVGGVSLAVYLGVAFLLGTEELKSVVTPPAATLHRKDGEIRHQASGFRYCGGSLGRVVHSRERSAWIMTVEGLAGM